MPTTFWETVDRMRPLMDQLKGGEERNWHDYRDAPQKGVYVLYEGGEPIYVGRTNRMPDRVREHGADSSDRYGATFAFKLLRQKLNAPEGKAADIEKAYQEEFRRAERASPDHDLPGRSH